MGTYIKNDADLKRFVKQISDSMKIPLKKALDEVAEVVQEMWKAHLWTYWYDVYRAPENQSEDQRTYETLESIVRTKAIEYDGKFIVSIHYDTDLINRYTNWHNDPDAMPYIVEEGDGLTTGHPVASHAMDRTTDWLKQKKVFENSVRNMLQQKGINI